MIHIKYHPLFIEQKRDPEFLGQFSCFFWALLSDPFVYKCWGQRAVEFFEGYLAFYHCSLNLTYKSQAICSLRKLCFTHPSEQFLLSPCSWKKTSSIYLHVKIQVRIMFSGHISWHNRSESGSLYTKPLYSTSIILIASIPKKKKKKSAHKTRNVAWIENRTHALDLQPASLQILLARYIHPEATLKNSLSSTPSFSQHCWHQDVNSILLTVLFKVSKSSARSNFKELILTLCKPDAIC